MHLYEIYLRLKSEEISPEQAAAEYGISLASLQRLQRGWGKRFPTLMRTLEGIRAGTISREEATVILGRAKRSVNHLMQLFGVHKPIGTRRIDRVQSSIKWELRKKFAIDWLSGGLSLDEAAELCNCHGRTLRRWAAALVKKHLHMTYADFKSLTDKDRRQYCDELDRLEGLEYDKKNKLDEIVLKRQELREEAIRRVHALRTNAAKAQNVRRG